MSRFLIAYENMDPASRLTCSFFRQFGEWSESRIRIMQVERIRQKDVDGCDIFIAVRPLYPLAAGIIRYAKDAGKKTGIVLDDDFLSMKDYRIRRPVAYRSLTRAVLLADLLFSTNDVLGKKLEDMSDGGKYIRIDTPVRAVQFADPAAEREKDPSGEMRVAYYVNDGNPEAVREVLEPAFPALNGRYGTRLKWYFIGLDPDYTFREKPACFEVVGKMPYPAFKAYLKDTGFDAGLAPLKASEFTKAKYINKFIEYTMAGIPGIYSDVAPYSGYVRDHETGLLCGNTPEEWAKAVSEMLQPGGEKYVLNARDKLMKEFSISEIGKRMTAAAPELLTFHAPARAGDKRQWDRMRMFVSCAGRMDMPLRAAGRLRTEGLGSTVGWIYQRYIKKNKV